mmetsp:Transcript_35574/g.53502  ORF Transcript_35574/g.53502 Transcript_35574/m.53502 type:complete len:92 (+) Transcript_35574:371-646(+)
MREIWLGSQQSCFKAAAGFPPELKLKHPPGLRKGNGEASSGEELKNKTRPQRNAFWIVHRTASNLNILGDTNFRPGSSIQWVAVGSSPKSL